MKYFSPSYIKAHPGLFAAGALVIFVIVLFVMNKGSGGETTTYVGGKTDAQVAAETALAMKQLDTQGAIQMGGLQISALAQQGQNDLALANVAAQVSLAQIAAAATSTAQATQAQLTVAMAQIGATVQMNEDNNQFQIAYAKNAQDNALDIIKVNAALQGHLADNQLEAYKLGSLLQSVSTLKKKDRDDTLERIFGNPAVIANHNPGTGSSGGSLIGGLPRLTFGLAGQVI